MGRFNYRHRRAEKQNCQEMNNATRTLMVLLAILSMLCLTNGAEITLHQGGYQGVVVAIHRDVPEVPAIVENIKAMFDRGSPFMFNATRRRLYFKQVTIVIPETWKEGNYTDVFTDHYSTSDIRVAEANPDFQDAPYTSQPGSCGEQGEYIHFTPKFLIEMDKWTHEMYGDAGRQLVHEWAHFRFGVFDEYGTVGDHRFPAFYMDDGKIVPSTCVKGVKGWALQENGDPCVVYEGAVVGPECTFIPDMNKQKQTASLSIMFMPFLPAMADFCDSEGDEAKQHNNRAPTKQNVLCGFKSTWQIIAVHGDITKGVPLAADTSTKTTFDVVRYAGRDARRIVLVMDMSTSMNGNDRLEKLRGATHRFISDTVPLGVSLGMVQFSNEAHKRVGMTKVVNDTSRTKLAESIPEAAFGGTAIGLGLMKALEVLREDDGRTEGALIILMSDGEENEGITTLETLPELLKAKVTVNTIAIGPEASDKLETVALRTGGRSYYFPDKDPDASGWDSAFQSSTSSQVDVEFQPIPLVSDTIPLVLNKTQNSVEKTLSLVIDKELGKNTVFTFHSSGTLRNLRVKLKSPSGKFYQNGTGEYDEDLNNKLRIKIAIDQAESGTWNVFLTSTANMSVGVTLTSEIRDPTEQPVRANAWFDNLVVLHPAMVKILARVTKGHNVVLNATVKATITRPNAEKVDMILRDDGAGADSIKDDGIYCRFFTNFTGNGRYGAVANVLNDGNAKLKIAGTSLSGRTSGSIGIPKPPKNLDSIPPQSEFDLKTFRQIDGPLPDPKTVTEPVDPFTRNADLGNFQLSKFNATVTVPPNKVSDLVVESVSATENRTNGSSMGQVTLAWTAAGDTMDHGTADQVDLRLSANTDDLITEFDSAFKSNVSVQMMVAGQRQRVTLALPAEYDLNLPLFKNTYDIYFALKTVNKAGQASTVSNIAAANIGYKSPPSQEASTTAQTTKETTIAQTTKKNYYCSDQKRNYYCSDQKRNYYCSDHKRNYYSY